MGRYVRNGGARESRGSGSTPLPFSLMHRTQRALVTSVSNCVELRAHVSSAAARTAARECCVVQLARSRSVELIRSVLGPPEAKKAFFAEFPVL